MRISDWSSYVCSSDLGGVRPARQRRRAHRQARSRSPLEWPRGEDSRSDRVRGLGRGGGPLWRRLDRKSVVEGKRVSGRVACGGGRIIKKKKMITRRNSMSNMCKV